jgi:hypothetical protein
MSLLTDDDWQKILEELPPGADRDAVMQDIEAAIERYRSPVRSAQITSEQAELWKRLGEFFTQKAFSKVRQRAGRLEAQNHDAEWLQRWCNEGATRVPRMASTWVKFYRSQREKERFYSDILAAWTDPGKGVLSISEKGPLQRFFCEITDHALPEPLTGRAVRDIVSREHERRSRRLLLAKANAGFQIDDSRVTIARSDPGGTRIEA